MNYYASRGRLLDRVFEKQESTEEKNELDSQ